MNSSSAVRTDHSCVWSRAGGLGIDHGAATGFPSFGWQAAQVKIGAQVDVRQDLTVAGSLGSFSFSIEGVYRRTKRNMADFSDSRISF